MEQLSYLDSAPRTKRSSTLDKQLREALTPYVDLEWLRENARNGLDLRVALRTQNAPPEVHQLLALLADVLRPEEREQIKSPADLAALLMIEMLHLDQEHLRVVCLDTKNRVQTIHTVYVGSVNSALIRVGEVFKDAIGRNSPAIIIVHNHPSGDPTPSPEDVMVTRQIIDAGKLLDIDVLDHLVIGRGKWVSLRERGLAFR